MRTQPRAGKVEPVGPASPGVGRATLVRYLRETAFASSSEDGRVGVELELIPTDVSTGRMAPVARVLASLRRAAACGGWTGIDTPSGMPGFRLKGGDVLSFEPGGQLEISTVALSSVDLVRARLLETFEVLRAMGREHGVALLCRGMDPLTPGDAVPLVTAAPRYLRQAAHYDRLGPWGRRMMLQSAAIHVNADLGDTPLLRWSVANRIAPYLTALFANSPRWEGEETGHRSWRAAQWRRLDPGRTGLPYREGDPLEAYLDFALDAPAFLLGDADAPVRPFREWAEGGTDGFAAHLTTLFPDVRPRGYLEIRCFDALPPVWWGVPSAVVAGVLYDRDSARAAREHFPPPTPELLERAGRLGVTDPEIRKGALVLLELATAGAERLGGRQIGEAVLADLGAFRSRYPERGRDPGHDPGFSGKE